MPALKNRRHEVFAQALARGMPAAAAYGQAVFKPRADGCPMHRIDGSVKYSCKHQAVVRKAKNEN